MGVCQSQFSKLCISIILVLFLVSCDSSKSIPVPASNSSDYVSGKKLCQELTQKEKGKWVPVGFYGEEKVWVYTHFVGEFDKEKPTVLYFTGGPGSHSHNLETQAHIANQLGHNFLAFDPRGVACSRPEKQKIYTDLNFVSSELFMQDALAILQAYDLASVVVWGSSYGTVPATMLASKAPDKVRALLLEGVFYKFSSSEGVKQQLYDFMQALNAEVLIKAENFHHLEYKNEREANPLFLILRDLSLYHGQEARQLFINHLNGSVLNAEADEVDYEVLRQWVDDTLGLYKKRDQIINPLVDPRVHTAIVEKELGRCTRDFNAVDFAIKNADLDEIKQTPSSDNPVACPEGVARSYVETLGLKEVGRTQWSPENYVIKYEKDIQILVFEDVSYSFGDIPQTYKPEDYSFTQPVYYFNGSHDLATPTDLALKHYESVRLETDTHHFIKFQGRGHHPINETFESTSLSQQQCLLDMLKQAFAGQALSLELQSCFSETEYLDLVKETPNVTQY